MALSFNVVKKWHPMYAENAVCGWVDITLDDSFPDGGWPVTADDLDISTLVGFMCPAISAGGVVLGWDAANGKILGFESTGDADAGTATTQPLSAYASGDDDCSTDIIRCYFEGV